MSALTLARKGLFPTITSDLFDPTTFFGPRLFDFNNDLFDLDLSVKIPSVNILENTKDYKIQMAAPGLEKKDFHVSVDNGMLTISAEKKMETKEEETNFTRKEFSFNTFSRTFRLPENCLPEKVDAKYENGILTLLLPKKEVTMKKTPKEIKVS